MGVRALPQRFSFPPSLSLPLSAPHPHTPHPHPHPHPHLHHSMCNVGGTRSADALGVLDFWARLLRYAAAAGLQVRPIYTLPRPLPRPLSRPLSSPFLIDLRVTLQVRPSPTLLRPLSIPLCRPLSKPLSGSLSRPAQQPCRAPVSRTPLPLPTAPTTKGGVLLAGASRRVRPLLLAGNVRPREAAARGACGERRGGRADRAAKDRVALTRGGERKGWLATNLWMFVMCV